VTTTLTQILLVLAALLCVAGGVAAWELIRTARSWRETSESVRSLADETSSRLVPLAEKADVTVDALNAELLRVDLIVTRFEEVADRAASIAHAPSELGERLRHVFATASSKRKAAGVRTDDTTVTDTED